MNFDELRYEFWFRISVLKWDIRELWYNALTLGKRNRCVKCWKKISETDPGTVHEFSEKRYALHNHCLKENLELSPEELKLLEQTLSLEYETQENEAEKLGLTRQEYIEAIELVIQRKSL